MTHTTVPAPPGVKMRIRVYSVSADGAVTQDRGTIKSLRYGEDLPRHVNGFMNGSRRARARAVVPGRR
ncbi:hypothetical protein [Streptomyces chiangmaiensis]|uniref:Uncharacterized protein n=1 Tax=Streptomyces chiangmaiensis TaxID=766497 RepID=A0ABU7FVA7_9ACTN|nr:hypothetical protein [Streptomyces chiangmaiensis]MED7828045.1 hypothetical protein [Streptomyces chiangmaiensis]